MENQKQSHSTNQQQQPIKHQHQSQHQRIVQLLEPPQPLHQSEFDYYPHDVNQNFQKVYSKIYESFIKLHRKSFAINFVSDLFNKIDVKEIRFQYEKFPFEIKELITRFKVEEIDNGSLSGFESEEHHGGRKSLLSSQGIDILSLDGPRQVILRKDKNLTKKQLKEMIKEKTRLVTEAQTELEQQKNVVNDLRITCWKDINHLRELLYKKEKLGDQFKEIDVRYFDLTEGLPKQYQEIMNLKIQEMKQGYQKILSDLASSNEALYKQVAILDMINKHGIKFKDMNAEHLISRLYRIQKDPQLIWNVLHQFYGDDYFIELIEDEYGISPQSYEKLQEQMIESINEFQEQSKFKIKELKDHYVIQIQHLRKELQTKNEEIGKLNREVTQVIAKTKKETEEELEELFKQKEINLFNRYDNEKQELYDRLRELEQTCEDFEQTKAKIKQKAFFTKWIFFSQLHRIKGSRDETRQQLAERTEKMLIEREMKSQKIRKLAEEHYGYKEEIFRVQNELATLKYEFAVKNKELMLLVDEEYQ
ncbi:UNKNOWN [Stylonychia lemnae]|uniref:Uncharacterized protein n=1 Tax=Stylonychia lemnae TaxID=5949 RepID=A0A078B448_STYLE|nr:UNKNOWN [Stylonychia lemnae]|eukprot:CDW87972.1 UNKNOWN [Stylonychia lemnae]